tara:strand:- start:940 stop:1527 length:588 start_codon:yes stop_codon:yes gene_type:complete
MTAVFDVVVNTDDLVVLAPPSVITVGVDFGPKGQRGATFYAGSGNPNSTTVSENVFGDSITPVEGDIYINTASGSSFGWLFIYNPKTIGDNWDQVLRLNPPIYSRTLEQTFTSGSSTLTIPVSEIVPPGVVVSSVDAYVVNLTPVSSNSTVLTVTAKTISGSNLQITVKGIKYSGGSWSDLNTETIKISTTITVV